MKSFLIIVVCGVLFSCSSKFEPVKINLESQWDSIRPLENPDKGWYHHMLDNGVHKYLIQDEEELHNFSGMDHLYLRLCWAFLEPEEGRFAWSYIDDIVEKYVPMGYGISFRISCKETGGAPGSVPKEIDGVKYATPYWVKQAGAKGIDCPEFGNCSWTPEWDDPVFLGKLNNFHKAFAEKYDGKPWVRYVDVGSIGEWGEGHTHRSTQIPPTVAEVKAHIDLYLKHYKNTQIVVTDDLIYWNKPEEDVTELLEYVKSKNITFRDDSPLVDWYVQKNLATWSVSHPHFFEAVYEKLPTIFELQHYSSVKQDGNWLGENGENTIPGLNVSGAEIFRKSMELIRPTYIGFHGYLGEWYSDNPELTDELLNLCGYWYFPKSVHIKEFDDDSLSFEIEWLNKGVAPAYHKYTLKGKLIPENEEKNTLEFEIEKSGNKNWMPGKPNTGKYNVRLTEEPHGSYHFAIQLFDKRSDKPVEIALKAELKDENGYFKVAKLKL
ncbi:MAG: hypothetical protein ACQEQ0_09055 [Bacteroidota bacterium]